MNPIQQQIRSRPLETQAQKSKADERARWTLCRYVAIASGV